MAKEINFITQNLQMIYSLKKKSARKMKVWNKLHSDEINIFNNLSLPGVLSI